MDGEIKSEMVEYFLQKNTKTEDTSMETDYGIFKQDFYDDTPFEWKTEGSDFSVDELLGSYFVENEFTPESLSGDDPNGNPLSEDVTFKEEGMEPFRDVFSLPYDVVMSSFDSCLEAESDSGVSSVDNVADFMLSPSSDSTIPDSRADTSVDTTDTVSDVSSTSDLGSLGSVGSPPNDLNGCSATPVRLDLSDLPQFEDDSDIKVGIPLQLNNFGENMSSFTTNYKRMLTTTPQFFTKLSTPTTSTTVTPIATRSIKVELSKPSQRAKPLATTTATTSVNTFTTKSPIFAKVRLDTSSASLKTTTTTSPSVSKITSPQTIVVTNAGKANTLLRNTTILKTGPGTGRQILVPVNVNVNDLNQVKKMKSFKIISATNAVNRPGTTGIRTLVSSVRPLSTATASTISASGNRTAIFTTSKSSDGRSVVKVTPAAYVTPTQSSDASRISGDIPRISVTSSYVKDEPSDDEEYHSNQDLVLTEEERRLMRKEGLILPNKYPLTKQEERDLKRIRRKIRNKISAQDSRKRKKEYVDGLEDRVKNCTEENQQLQKRIKTLERQNESLLVQLKKFQNLFNIGLNYNRPHTHTSTALMMLILSAALFVIPSLRSQDAKGDSDLTKDANIPSAGHTRNLLEAKNNALNMQNLEAYAGLDDDEIDPLAFPQALSDHDYAPAAKKARLDAYRSSFFSPPKVDKTLSLENGDPPDNIGGLNRFAALFGAMLDRFSSNWTSNPTNSLGGALNRTPPHGTPERSSVVVNLNQGRRWRDDIELE